LGACTRNCEHIHVYAHEQDLPKPFRFADITLFGVVFLSEMAVFAADTVATARQRIRNALKDVDRDR